MWEPEFVRHYLEFTAETEPPEIYRKWVAISLIAACAKRNFWVWYGDYKVPLYQYIMLAGPSGARKTTAIDDGLSLLEGIQGFPLSSDSITRESLMEELAEKRFTVKIPDRDEPMEYCALYVVAREFFSFFRAGDQDFWRWLVNIYDGKPEVSPIYAYRTKKSGTTLIPMPCLNFIGATTPEGLAEAVPKSAIGSGFTARITFVYALGRQKACPFPSFGNGTGGLKAKLKGHLLSLYQRQGEIRWVPEAREAYASWYSCHDMPDSAHPAVRAWFERLPNFALRLAGISVLADGRGDLLIYPRDVEWALACLNGVAENMSHVFVAMGGSRIAVAQQELFEFIKSHGPEGASRGALVKRFLQDIEPSTLNKLLDLLEKANLIVPKRPTGGVLRYVWTGEEFDEAKLKRDLDRLGRLSRRGL